MLIVEALVTFGLFCVADCVGMVVFAEGTDVVPWAGITGIDTLVAEEASAGCGAGALMGGSGEFVVLSREHTKGESIATNGHSGVVLGSYVGPSTDTEGLFACEI